MDTQWVISMCVFSVTIFREILEMTTCLHTRGGGRGWRVSSSRSHWLAYKFWCLFLKKDRLGFMIVCHIGGGRLTRKW